MNAVDMRHARVVAVIQARMGSSRLPGKVTRLLGDMPVLEWVIAAARRASEVDEVVVATSVHPSDDVIEALATRCGVRVVRGDELDVLSRYILAARLTNANAVVRLTSDCPLLDSDLIDSVVRVWRADSSLDYVSTTLVRSLPRGLDVELATTRALNDVDATAIGYHRTHVTSALYEDGAGYLCAGLVFRPDNSHFRVTIDEGQDAEALEALVRLLPPGPVHWHDVVAVLESNPSVVALNAAVSQKALEDG